MEVEEFEERTKSIVEVELKKITTMVKKIPDKNAKKQANLLGLSTIDHDIKSNPLALRLSVSLSLIISPDFHHLGLMAIPMNNS